MRSLPLTNRRFVAPIGGTLRRSDCKVIAHHLAAPRSLVKGPAIANYEREFAKYIGTRFAYSFASGRLGLFGILQALDVGAGDEVLLQVPTHVVVPNAIRHRSAIPIYVDCARNTYNIDFNAAKRFVTARTKVLLVQHTFGVPVDMDTAAAFADEHGLALVEDCAHALGARYAGCKVGSFGRASFFSTEEKTISSAMGGIVVTNDPMVASRIYSFQQGLAWPSALLTARYLLKLLFFYVITEPSLHPYTRPLYRFFRSRYIAPGATSVAEAEGRVQSSANTRLSNAQAAAALSQLRNLEANLSHRTRIAGLYAESLTMYGFSMPEPPVKATPAFARYPVLVKDKKLAAERSSSCVALGQWLSEVIDGARPPATADYVPGSCPNAEAVVRHLVNLPTHLRVREQDVSAIVSALRDEAWHGDEVYALDGGECAVTGGRTAAQGHTG
jgi:dTDP-4-amino-4,6-dideoxygalactose transaminase